MEIKDLIKKETSVQLVVNAADLKELFIQWNDEISYRHVVSAEEGYMSPNDVANKYHVSKVSLWRWAKLNILVPVKLGRKSYYKKSDIDKLFNMEGHK